MSTSEATTPSLTYTHVTSTNEKDATELELVELIPHRKAGRTNTVEDCAMKNLPHF